MEKQRTVLWCFEGLGASLEPEPYKFVHFVGEEASAADNHDKPKQQEHDKPRNQGEELV